MIMQTIFYQLKNLNQNDLLKKYPFLGKRSETILAGIELGFEIADVLNVDFFKISTKGLRHGILFSGRVDNKYVQL